tara:strand:- start:53 stop:295 length:243 start_codon:yes stop_codon:yes gene_type:complete
MTEIDGEFPEAAPVHLSNKYSELGEAVKDICVPSSTIPPLGLIAPPSIGLTDVVKEYLTVSLEQEKTSGINSKRISFLTT